MTRKHTALLVTILAGLAGLAGCSADEPATESTEAALSSPIAVAAAGGNPAAEGAANQITDEYMREIIAEISSDAYEGRGPGSAGDEKARQYLAGRMEELGLEPGGEDGSWEQLFDLVGVNTMQPPTWTFEGHDKSLILKQWDQYMINSDVHETHAEVSDAEVVFVGYGIQAPEYDWDDFKDADLDGKILLIMNNDPDWDPDLFAGETRLWYGRWDYKYQKAADQGAVGAIIIHTTPSAGYPFQVLQTSNTGVQFELPAGDEARKQFDAWMIEDAARELVAMAGMDLDELREAAYNRDFEPVPLGITTSIAMDVEIDRVQSANVLGLIPGSDTELKDEVVIYSAHHDHLGIGPANEAGDTIYNGAFDNASGVALVMGIAKAMMSLPEAPRRSVLIALVGAEEQGLLGSKYYAGNPTFPVGNIAANINYDGGNVWGHSHDVTFVGLGKSTIDQLVELIAGEQGRVITPDQFPSKGSFYRSDQFSFARIGVPAAYLDPGTNFVDRPEGWGKKQVDHYTEVNYHQPSDEYDPNWNLDGMIRDAQLGYWTGLAIANADEMPVWNEGDEFEAARLEALAAEED
ncbi:MAG: M28 family peptidase [Gammaproteobacteria bacterium]|nr:M28 family peptidase [Gammaproteobacteria bacterium]MDH3751071.1 M28 family peptidase [Gammaproteobacteria bacterium]MDH3806181.1 M28 family peptidase [Gammaproteobacteria bacterium]